jgi:hypothetical protein
LPVAELTATKKENVKTRGRSLFILIFSSCGKLNKPHLSFFLTTKI